MKDDGWTGGVVLGRTYLDENPFFLPVMDTLEMLTPLGGTGMLLE